MTVPAWVKPGLWGAVLGAVAAMIVGFSWGGWTSASAAEKMSVERAELAVVVALTPHCVAQAMTDPESAALLSDLAEVTSSYQRRNFVSDAGWATLPGQEKANRDLAVSCAQALEETPPA